MGVEGMADHSESHNKDVVGSFEWVCDFTFLEPIFKRIFNTLTDAQKSGQSTQTNDILRILDVGCGTSTIAMELKTCFGPNIFVHSIDNDVNCVKHMKEKYRNEENLTWMVYDMVECPNVEEKEKYMVSDSFDIIFDKGSLDAILVEGCISPMLCEVYRLLKPGGVYFLCSIHPKELLEPLFGSYPLHYQVEFPLASHQLFSTSKVGAAIGEHNTQLNIALCTKPHVKIRSVIDIVDMNNKENEVMKRFFQTENPVLTAAKRQELEDYCRKRGFAPFSLSEAHSVVINVLLGLPIDVQHDDNLTLDYTFDLFKEDLTDFKLENQGAVGFEELLLFISSKQ